MRKIAFLGDVHSNIQALTSVLKDIERQGVDQIICLGDLIGYGANPKECFELRRRFGAYVAGNHELAVIDDYFFRGMNHLAKEGVQLTKVSLAPGQIGDIDQLPAYGQLGRIKYAHGSTTVPDQLKATTYVAVFEGNVESELKAMADSEIAMIGHTHIAEIHAMDQTGRWGTLMSDRGRAQRTYRLLDGVKYLINVGSIGQPRDFYSTASYGIMHVSDTDEHHYEPRSVEYDVDAAVKAIINVGLPVELAYRLYEG